ncbi:transaldolase family protein [Streptomyces sp. AD55]|uniref:transaldolase family protein n=1 Tax=Streptomyces sp. AD55 TaxID=3242895 RepID=UPI0035277F59
MTMGTCSAGGGALAQLTAEGVALWLDDWHRGRVAGGGLGRLVEAGLVRGAVSRPAAVVRALAGGTAYRGQLDGLQRTGVPAEERAYALIAEDARAACAALEPVFRSTRGLHGWVSVGLAPRLASDAGATVDHALRLARTVGRPNLLVRVPAAGRGMAAAGDLLARGVGVHLTSVFSVRRYAEAVDVYFRGLERAAATGAPHAAVTSLVSVDVGHLDAGVDALLDASRDPSAAGLLGTAGTATAQLLYRRYEESLGCPQWRTLAAGGALPQRLLWTSEHTPEEPRAALDRVERLIAWMTLHALPEGALGALERRSGFHGDTVSGRHGPACRVLDGLERAGVLLDSVARHLEQAALERELAAWDALLSAVGTR